MCYVLYFVCVCVCVCVCVRYAMGHAAWNKSYDDDDDYNNQHILCVDYTHQTTKILKLYT